MLDTSIFYKIRSAVDTKETGKVYPSTETYKDYNFQSYNSVHNLRAREFPSFIPDIRFKLSKKAKLCDLLSTSAISVHGLLISERFKVLLEKYQSVPCKYHEASIEVNRTFHQYYFVQYVWNEGINLIDFKESKFRIKKFDEIISPIQINNYEDLRLKQKELGFVQIICSNDIKLNKIPENLDIIIDPLNFGIYVNEKLKNEILFSKFTGVELTPNSTLKMF